MDFTNLGFCNIPFFVHGGVRLLTQQPLETGSGLSLLFNTGKSFCVFICRMRLRVIVYGEHCI